MFKRIIQVLIIIVVISCKKDVDEISSATWVADESNNIIAVEGLEISRGNIYPAIKSAGIISGIKEAFIVSETRGIIKNINFQIGDYVDKSKVLLNVDDTIVKLSMEQAKQQNNSAQLDLKSTETLYNNGSASLAELTRARSSANGARAFYESSLKAYDDSFIKSSIIGAVAWKGEEITQGNYINQGVKIARIVDMSAIRIKLSVGERQISLIDLGAETEIYISSLYNSETIKGEVVAIAAGSDIATGSYSVVVEAPNNYPDSLKSGMSSLVLIKTKSLNPQIIVPTDSIVERDGKDYVFIDKEGIAEPYQVEKGEIVGNRTVILNGLTETEKIIISGLGSVKPGIKIRSTIIGKSGDWL